MSKPSEIPAEDLVEIRAQLAPASSGPEFWRSLEELAGTPKFQHFLHREFPENATELSDPESRRHFLKLMGASLALAGVSGCAIRPPEQIAPWVKSPENIVPGRPQFYATSMVFSGLATGLIVESHAGRPTKVEGNPDHPASLGSTDIFAQAAPLNLYDPDRSQAIMRAGENDNYVSYTYDDFLAALTNEMTRLRPKNGAGLRILSEAVSSPSLAAQIKELIGKFPEAKWYRYEPVSKDYAKAGSKLAFGEILDPVFHFDKADVILSLEADFLACGSPGRTADERAYAARREPKAGVMNRLYVAEAAYTNTGGAADHRLAVKSSEIAELALAVAAGVGVEGATAPSLSAEKTKWVAALVKDLKAHKGKALVIVGDAQPAAVHAVGIAINAALGSIGADGPISYIEPVEADPVDNLASIVELTKEIEAGKVETLLIFGGNPAYTAPADLGIDQSPEDAKLKGLDGLTKFARLLKKVPLSIRLGTHFDETSNVCTWHVPEAHFLESWGDARAFDGTASVIQPLIAPLYSGKSAHELLSAMLGEFDRSPLKVVQDYWKGQTKDVAGFAFAWKKAIHDGKIDNTAFQPKTVPVKPFASFAPKPSAVKSEFEILFRPDPTIWDGRYANNGWLQELPKPITKLTWDNAALISPASAKSLKLDILKDNGRIVELIYNGRTLKVPVYIVPGQAEGTVVLHLGYGRSMAGRVGTGIGFNAYALRTSDAPWGGPGAALKVTDATYPLASTQMHRYIEGRDLYRFATLADFIKDPNYVNEGAEHSDETLIPAEDTGWVYDSHKWGMAIDLNACTGCNACVISCQAENNIPVIGKEQIMLGRNMQWMEIDTYFHGADINDPEIFFQPRACMHCENAPCELVCPVAATVHDAEGLNVMVYNRCVGTRYCGNNCPYKVRHFNFLNYSEIAKPSMRTPSLQLLNNPDVTVRTRGVMEKCTYCVQRISGARIDAKERGGDQRIKDGEVITACQSACPSQAIHFGDLNDKSSKIYKIKEDSRNYAMLGELNTRPRTTYLGKVRNPNPELIEA
jgi:molybdopterin-containing oxidoreductase family iron-sulfur binding subunit